MRILVDMDEVVARIYPKWLEAYNRDYKDNLVEESITGWNAHLYVKPQCGYNIYNYIARDGFFSDVPVVPGSQEVLNRLYNEGHEIVFVSASPRNSKTATYDKFRWLKRNFPELDHDAVVFTHRKDLVNGDLLIDDGPHNLEDFPGMTCAFDRPWNRHVGSTFRAKTWAEIEVIVKGLEI